MLRIHCFLPYNSPGAGAGTVLFLKGRSRAAPKLINLHIRQIQSRDVFKENTLSTNKKIEKEKRKKTRCRSRKEVRLENKMKENTLTSKNSKET